MASKLWMLMMVLIVIQVNLLIFDRPGDKLYSTTDSTFTNYTDNGTSLWQMFQQPQQDSSGGFNSFWKYFAVGVGGAILLTGLLFRNDLMTFGPVVAVVLSWSVMLINLWRFLNKEIGSLTSSSGLIAPMIASLLVVPLLIWALTTTMAWWKGQDT